MRFHRIEDPLSPDETRITSLLETGVETVVLQFSKSAAYGGRALGKLNQLCERFGSRLNVRFYGHYGSEFDARVLRYIPAVRSLNIDCLTAVTHLESLDDLTLLEEFGFGVFEANVPSLLESKALTRLRKLVLSSTRKNNIDLAPLASYPQLHELFINGHTAGIEAVGTLCSLQKLLLGGIGKKKSLSFIKSLVSLKALTYILGGRTDVNDLAHDGLERLEILRVLGLPDINLALFPKLKHLTVEDQLRLQELDIRPVRELQRLSVVNCKNLTRLVGVDSAVMLESLRVGRTSVELNQVLDSLPPNMKALTLHSPRKSLDEEIQLRVASLCLPDAYYTGAP